MKTDFLFLQPVRKATTIVLLLVAVFTMLAAHQPGLAWWAAQAPWIAVLYVLMAMALLMFSRTRLMFVCLGCSAAICLFFNEIKSKNLEEKLQNTEQCPPEVPRDSCPLRSSSTTN